jgi:hypothetical protein
MGFMIQAPVSSLTGLSAEQKVGGITLDVTKFVKIFIINLVTLFVPLKPDLRP